MRRAQGCEARPWVWEPLTVMARSPTVADASAAQDSSVERIRELGDIAMRVVWWWALAMFALALLSVVHVMHRTRGTSWTFELTNLTAVLLALIWLPVLLRVIGIGGGTL